MSQENNNTLHDAFFKQTFTCKKVAQEFLQKYLPKDVLDEIDLSDFSYCPTNHITQVLKQSYNDVIVKCKTKSDDQNAIIFLLEHQSSSDYWMPFRLLEYFVHVLKPYAKNRNKLPIVYPYIIYNGKTKYSSPKHLWNLFYNPKLAQKVLLQDFDLLDLSQTPDKEIKSVLDVVLYAMKHAFDNNEELQTVMTRLEAILKSSIIEKSDDPVLYKRALVTYANPNISESQLLNILNSNNPMKQAFGAIEKKAREEERQTMKQAFSAIAEKNRQDERITMVKNMLAEGIDTQVIAKVSGLSEAQIQKIKNIKVVEKS